MRPQLLQTENLKPRHKLLKPLQEARLMLTASRGASDDDTIKTLAQLKQALQTAIELEHSTIPLYLTALYSIKDGTNARAIEIIRGIAVEEMLHMVLACNILNAIGGKPVINRKGFIPTYPGSLPHSDGSFTVNLAKFCKPTVGTFLRIELPKPSDAPPKYKNYHTIGQFYMAVRLGLERLGADIFTGDPARQITPEHYYGSGGMIVPVYNMEDACKAIEEIVGQGEGIDDTIVDSDEKMFGQGIEYAHYFRFNELYCEQAYTDDDTPKSGPTGDRVDVAWDAVFNMKENPKMSDYAGHPEIEEKARAFNRMYTHLLDNIHDAVNGHPERLMTGMAQMYQLKYKAVELMNIPLPGTGYMAGPTFEYEK